MSNDPTISYATPQRERKTSVMLMIGLALGGLAVMLFLVLALGWLMQVSRHTVRIRPALGIPAPARPVTLRATE
jgi:threonine/homoserine/homoserine lactone efflux protein